MVDENSVEDVTSVPDWGVELCTVVVDGESRIEMSMISG